MLTAGKALAAAEAGGDISLVSGSSAQSNTGSGACGHCEYGSGW